ncbi:MAG: dTDP-4-dehydrorhamnose 3,5-epimerase [Paracoccaceae bacterium]|jgi:dTDP-4-dehydrorhamnose 3,5-epimerase
MRFAPLSLAGAYEVTLERREDARGFFARIFCEQEFEQAGLNTRWVQMNMSHSNAKGTVRGMHFQRDPAAEVKLVRCLRGAVWDVIVDLRAGSDSYGKICTVTLEAASGNAIYIPKGFAHGFQTLTPDAELQYFHSAVYAPDCEGGISPFDPDLAIDWPLPAVSVSDRDRDLPALAESVAL